MLQHRRTLVLVRYYQLTQIFSYVTLITVQNYLHLSDVKWRASKEHFKGVVLPDLG